MVLLSLVLVWVSVVSADGYGRRVVTVGAQGPADRIVGEHGAAGA